MYRDLQDYYLHWYHTRPVGISTVRQEELRRLHRVLYTAIGYFAGHYAHYIRDWGFGEKEWELLERASCLPFRAGTYRPDYILSHEKEILLCEITSRFFAHGIFMSWFGEQAGRAFTARFPGVVYQSDFGPMMDYMLSLAGGRRKMYVLKSADRTGEIRLYKRFYESYGIQVEVLEAPEVEDRRKEWCRDAFVVSALNQKDILSFSMDTLQAMDDAGMVSDFRNVFLVHDKRFPALWFEDRFTDACLNREDAAFLRAHAIPSFLQMPEDAYDNKDAYILKPVRLGKSEGVMAGPLVSVDQWHRRLDQGVEGCLFQPFIGQITFPTVWEGTPFQDYLCGMMLCVNDRYFQSGYFRFSSLPVTNVGDDRKAFPLYTDNPEILSQCDLL